MQAIQAWAGNQVNAGKCRQIQASRNVERVFRRCKKTHQRASLFRNRGHLNDFKQQLPPATLDRWLTPGFQRGWRDTLPDPPATDSQIESKTLPPLHPSAELVTHQPVDHVGHPGAVDALFRGPVYAVQNLERRTQEQQQKIKSRRETHRGKARHTLTSRCLMGWQSRRRRERARQSLETAYCCCCVPTAPAGWPLKTCQSPNFPVKHAHTQRERERYPCGSLKEAKLGSLRSTLIARYYRRILIGRLGSPFDAVLVHAAAYTHGSYTPGRRRCLASGERSAPVGRRGPGRCWSRRNRRWW